MEPIKKLPAKTALSNLSVALRTDNKTLAIRELSQISIYKILDGRDARSAMVFELEGLRNSYKFFKKTKHIEGRITHLATLRKLGNELKAKLDQIPEYPTLFELRNKDEQEAIRVLCLMIISLVQYHNTSEVMSTDMVQEVAMRIMFQFGGLTLEDVGLCFHQVKNGTRGKVYNRVDAAVIMNWLHDYEADVQAIGQERNARLHNQGKTGIIKEGHEYRIVQPARLKDLV
jgi:hypothetical protein